jgi:ribosome-associated protein
MYSNALAVAFAGDIRYPTSNGPGTLRVSKAAVGDRGRANFLVSRVTFCGARKRAVSETCTDSSPRMKDLSPRSLKIGDRPINLTQVLKLAGCVQSGGEAKAAISAGAVRVNGEIELRKRRKLKAGDIVLIEDGRTVELST